MPLPLDRLVAVRETLLTESPTTAAPTAPPMELLPEMVISATEPAPEAKESKLIAPPTEPVPLLRPRRPPTTLPPETDSVAPLPAMAAVTRMLLFVRELLLEPIRPPRFCPLLGPSTLIAAKLPLPV